MKRIHADEDKQSTQNDFLLVIEGDPNDYRTIFITLKECMRLDGSKVTTVTFDLPILLKAADIIKQANLPIIPSVGWFHLLKFYLASMGNIMDDSGLLEFDPVDLSKDYDGRPHLKWWCFDKVIRTRLLIDVAICRIS
jgi:hypothetical protein